MHPTQILGYLPRRVAWDRPYQIMVVDHEMRTLYNSIWNRRYSRQFLSVSSTATSNDPCFLKKSQWPRKFTSKNSKVTESCFSAELHLYFSGSLVFIPFTISWNSLWDCWSIFAPSQLWAGISIFTQQPRYGNDSVRWNERTLRVRLRRSILIGSTRTRLSSVSLLISY